MEFNFLKTIANEIKEAFQEETFRGIIKYRARILLVILLIIIFWIKYSPN